MARVRPGEAANPAPPTVQRIRVRFAKRGRLRFLSHRDVARSVERAVRRAGIPVAHSHGFSPASAAVVDRGRAHRGCERGRVPGDRAHPPARPRRPRRRAGRGAARRPRRARRRGGRGHAAGRPDRRERVAHRTARCHPRRPARSRRRPAGGRGRRRGAGDAVGAAAGRRAGGTRRRGGVDVVPTPMTADCAIMTAVVRQTTPAVRPDDVLGALDVVAGLKPPAPAKATRMAQGLLDDRGRLTDPLGPDRVTTRA